MFESNEIGIAFLNNRIMCRSRSIWAKFRRFSFARFSYSTVAWSLATVLL